MILFCVCISKCSFCIYILFICNSKFHKIDVLLINIIKIANAILSLPNKLILIRDYLYFIF